jgi:hypothetical protein
MAMRSPSRLAVNLHEGSRSEYLFSFTGELNQLFKTTAYAFEACDSLLKMVKEKLADQGITETGGELR